MTQRAIISWLAALNFRALPQSAARELRWLKRRLFDRNENAAVTSAHLEPNARPLRDAMAAKIEEMKATLRKNGRNV